MARQTLVQIACQFYELLLLNDCGHSDGVRMAPFLICCRCWVGSQHVADNLIESHISVKGCQYITYMLSRNAYF